MLRWLAVGGAVAACGGDDDGGTDAGAREVGGVLLAQFGQSGTFVSGLFGEPTVLGAPVAEAAGCTLHRGPQRGLSVGVLTVTGGTQPIEVAPDTDAIVTYERSVAADAYAPGATLTVTAAGADLPGFSGSVVAPEPVLGFSDPGSLSMAAPPTLTWTPPGAAGTRAWIVVSALDNNTPHDDTLRCPTDDDGSHALAAEALGLLPPESSGATIMVFRVREVDVETAALAVGLTAAAVAEHEVPFDP